MYHYHQLLAFLFFLFAYTSLQWHWTMFKGKTTQIKLFFFCLKTVMIQKGTATKCFAVFSTCVGQAINNSDSRYYKIYYSCFLCSDLQDKKDVCKEAFSIPNPFKLYRKHPSMQPASCPFTQFNLESIWSILPG